MDFDDDDRGVGPSSGADAGFGPSEEPVVDLALDNDESLDKQGLDRPIWLVKVPKFLLERWQNVKEDGVELGRLRVYHKPMPDGEQRISVMVNPAKPGEEEIPTEYFLTMQNKATKNTFIFGEREDVSIGEAGWEPGRGRIRPEQTADGKQVNKAPAKKRMPRFTGTVNVGDSYWPAEHPGLNTNEQHECNLTPRLDSESYRSIMRSRSAKAAEPKRRLVKLEGHGQEHNRLGISGMSTRKFDTFIKGKAKPKGEGNVRLARIPRNELLDLLFSAFEQYDYWSIKNLKAHTQQPEVYLKEVLPDIGLFNQRGPYVGMWCLQEQFRKNRAKKEEVKDPSEPTASTSTSAVKQEDQADVKPTASDLEDDDEDMEEV